MLKPNSNQVYPFQSNVQGGQTVASSQSAPLLSGEHSLVNSTDNNNVNNGGPLRSVNSTGSLHNPEGAKSSPVTVPPPAEGSLYLSGSNAPASFQSGQLLLSSIGQPQRSLSAGGADGQNGGMLLQGNAQPRPAAPPAAAPNRAATAPGTHAVGALTSSKTPKPWHNAEADAETRQLITNKIIALLQARKTTASSNDWLLKLPQMAKKLEEALYFGASSSADYGDQRTLKHRLQQLAASMGSAKAPSHGHGSASQSSRPAPQSSGAPNGNPVASKSAPQAPVAAPARSAPATPPVAAPAAAPSAASAPPPAPAAPARQFISMSQINSLIGGQPQAHPAAAPPPAPAPAAAAPEKAASSNTAGDSQKPSGQLEQTEESRKQQVLKQQQQRLLLLRHASKCPNDAKCHVTPHCAGMKQLWKHIMTCRDQDCKTSHCVSSRYVLSHYSKCKDAACPVCGPVREAIRRNQEKSPAGCSWLSPRGL